MNTNLVKSLVVGFLSTLTVTGCVSDPSTDTEIDSEDVDSAAAALTTALTRPGNAKLRVVSWNTMRGGVFPRSDTVWKAINKAGTWDQKRTDYAKEVFQAVNADVWLLQETAYGDSLPAGISVGDINSKIEGYMEQITGKGWTVKCNGKGLCMMARDTIGITKTCMSSGRTNGYLLDLPSTNASLAVGNVHYMNESQANETATMMKSSTATAKLVAGDFNDVPGGPRYIAIDNVPTLDVISMKQLKDSGAIHLTSDVKNGTFINTKGYVEFNKNISGQALVSKESGGQIDHIFFGGSSFPIRQNFILNTLLLSKETLNQYKLHPLAVSINPEKHASYFTNFLSTGKISVMPSDTPSVDHDHLPLIIDLDYPSAVNGSSPNLVCP
jgi:hypothetical protein